MKSMLICPAEQAGIPALSLTIPLALVPLAGKNILEYWLEHLIAQGMKEVTVLASDRAEQIQAFVGKGGRWGINAEVIVEPCALSVHFARTKYQLDSKAEWLDQTNDVVLMDRLPGLSQYPLFKDYAGWFAGLQTFLPRAAITNRIGVHEINPGIWVGRRTRISPSAQLIGPCWIGERVSIGPLATIGPMAVLEDRVMVETGSEIAHSVVGPDTMVGRLTEVRNSIALGEPLVNWKTNSCVTVPDPLLLSALKGRRSASQSNSWMAQLSSLYTRNKDDFQMLWKHFPSKKGGLGS
jgi:NDP-sugar pyrophosphorylase family protein